MKKFRTLAVVGVSVIAFTTSGCSTGQTALTPDSDGLTTVNVGHVQLATFAPLYVAEAQNYFKDEGIKLNLQSVKSGSDAVPLASSGQLDVVLAGFSAGLFSSIQSGLDIKVVGSMGVSDGTERSPAELLVSKGLVDNGDVETVSDLKGKKIAAAGGAGATGAYLLSIALEDAGLSLSDVDLINLGNPDMPTALQSGSIDGALVTAPFSTNSVADGSGVSLFHPPQGSSATGVIYSGKFIDSPIAQKFFNAMTRAAKDLQGEERYSDANRRILADATDQSPQQMEAIPLYSWLPDLRPLPDQLTAMEKVWMEAGQIKYTKPIKQQDYIDDTFSQSAP